jgi:sirohydrochlorin cobaltochelatase
MTISAIDRTALDELDSRLRIVLPEQYQDSYETIEPVSMGSAGLKFGDDGRVAWDEIWGSFCDLAMAGGPPHKGTLLEPPSPAAIEAEPDRYREVVDEICRGVTMVTDLPTDESPVPGWVRVHCYSPAMAGWLLRAIVMENVAARTERLALDLPASPAFRLDKEIKNVVTVIAKTCHYWLGHMRRSQREAIAGLFARISSETPLIEPTGSSDGRRSGADAPLFAAVAEGIRQDTGLSSSPHQYAGWLGVVCPSVGSAVWMMRALVVSNVLARREGVVLFVPVNRHSDPDGQRVRGSLARAHRLAVARGII